MACSSLIVCPASQAAFDAMLARLTETGEPLLLAMRGMQPGHPADRLKRRRCAQPCVARSSRPCPPARATYPTKPGTISLLPPRAGAMLSPSSTNGTASTSTPTGGLHHRHAVSLAKLPRHTQSLEQHHTRWLTRTGTRGLVLAERTVTCGMGGQVVKSSRWRSLRW